MNYQDAINWLKKAQDITPNAGVSAFYTTTNRVWQPSYPETTGYIIPTLIAAGEHERALAASRWLRQTQLPNGALPSGFWVSYIPNVFHTGMVMLGWIAAQELEYDPRTRESLDKALEYMEDAWINGEWANLKTYCTRAVWPLHLLKSPFVEDMLDMFEERLTDDLWPEHAEDDEQYPLSHFLVYIGRGFYECGRVELATRYAEKLAEVHTKYGILPARLNRNWERYNSEICVPAIAQAAILWDKVGLHTYADNAKTYLYNLDAPWASDPKNGEYIPNSQINWTAKFVADALWTS